MPDAFNMTVMRPYDVTIASNAWTDGANLLTDQPGERAAMTTSTGGLFRMDLGSAKPVQQVALLYTDASSTATWTVTVSNNSDMTSPVYSSGAVTALDAVGAAAVAGYRHAFLHLAAPITGRYVQISVNQAMTAGRAAVGLPFQTESNADYGDTSWGYEEAPDPDTLDSGVTILEELPAAPYFEFRITWATEAEMELDWNGKFGSLQWLRKPVLVVRRPDAHAYRHSGIFWGVLRLQPFVAAEFDLHEVSGKIRSMV